MTFFSVWQVSYQDGYPNVNGIIRIPYYGQIKTDDYGRLRIPSYGGDDPLPL